MSLARPNKLTWYHGTKRMRLLVQTTDDVGPPLEKHSNFSGRARSMTVPCVSVLLCSYWWNLRVLHPSGAQSNQIDCIFFTAARPGPRLLFIFLLLWSFQSAQSCNRFLFGFSYSRRINCIGQSHLSLLPALKSIRLLKLLGPLNRFESQFDETVKSGLLSKTWGRWALWNVLNEGETQVMIGTLDLISSQRTDDDVTSVRVIDPFPFINISHAGRHQSDDIARTTAGMRRQHRQSNDISLAAP